MFENLASKPRIAVYEKQTFIELYDHPKILENQAKIELELLSENPVIENWENRPELLLA